MVLQPSGLLRSSQEAVSYFEHAASPARVSLSASEMPGFLLQMRFSSPPDLSPAALWRKQTQLDGCTGMRLLWLGLLEWVFKEQLTFSSSGV